MSLLNKNVPTLSVNVRAQGAPSANEVNLATLLVSFNDDGLGLETISTAGLVWLL